MGHHPLISVEPPSYPEVIRTVVVQVSIPFADTVLRTGVSGCSIDRSRDGALIVGCAPNPAELPGHRPVNEQHRANRHPRYS